MDYSYGPMVVNAITAANKNGATGALLMNFTGAQNDGCSHPGRIGHWEMYEIGRVALAKALGW